MFKNKKTLKLSLISLIIMIIAVFITINFMNDERNVLKENWNISLPSTIQLSYKKEDLDSFHHEGTKYLIFDSVELSKEYFTQLSNQKNTDVETQFKKFYSDYDIDTKYQFMFSHQYYWKVYSQYYDELYMIYNLENHKIYILEFIL